MSSTRIFVVTMPHDLDPADSGMIAELNYYVRAGVAQAWGDDPRDTRYTVHSLRQGEEPKPDVVNAITGNAANVVQCGNIDGGVRLGGAQ